MIIQHEDTNTVLTEQDLIDIYMEGYNEGIQAVEEDTAVKKWLRKNVPLTDIGRKAISAKNRKVAIGTGVNPADINEYLHKQYNLASQANQKNGAPNIRYADLNKVHDDFIYKNLQSKVRNQNLLVHKAFNRESGHNNGHIDPFKKRSSN